jgi:hypothetical protein
MLGLELRIRLSLGLGLGLKVKIRSRRKVYRGGAMTELLAAPGPSSMLKGTYIKFRGSG